ncbi:hypothetical protein GWC95_19345 [Sediminibacterium roseum]|uniref:Lipoprotein n=1 Tax=Sediminibacterium roseum TaxID=1978412 RepID=A0ABW9ZYE7_9BACT|nr:hypothetical protein [Sediminibacterium roseum]NCI52089.1 hypothetical protein [Sediminibacterium roseum]
MKIKILSLCFAVAVLFSGCSKDADDAYNSSGSFSATDINGTWKEPTSGVVVTISGVTSGGSGSGRLTNVGSAFPAAALNGICMKQVEHQSGGYWDAYNQSYTGSTWVQGSVIGLAMNDDKKSFKIGSKSYYRQ